MRYQQMAWLEAHEGADRKILHLRNDNGQWKPYTAFPTLCKPDITLPGASKGYPTMQHLLKSGWTLVSTTEALSQRVLASAK